MFLLLGSSQFKWYQTGKQNFIKEAGTTGYGFPEESKREGLKIPGKRLERHSEEGWKGELEHNRKEKEGKDRGDRPEQALPERQPLPLTKDSSLLSESLKEEDRYSVVFSSPQFPQPQQLLGRSLPVFFSILLLKHQGHSSP